MNIDNLIDNYNNICVLRQSQKGQYNVFKYIIYKITYQYSKNQNLNNEINFHKVLWQIRQVQKEIFNHKNLNAFDLCMIFLLNKINNRYNIINYDPLKLNTLTDDEIVKGLKKYNVSIYTLYSHNILEEKRVYEFFKNNPSLLQKEIKNFNNTSLDFRDTVYNTVKFVEHYNTLECDISSVITKKIKILNKIYSFLSIQEQHDFNAFTQSFSNLNTLKMQYNTINNTDKIKEIDNYLFPQLETQLDNIYNSYLNELNKKIKIEKKLYHK